MHLYDVLKKCKEEGYSVTASGLYFAGKKHGFLKKVDGCKFLDFDKVKFLEWLEKNKEEIPEGWVTLKELSSILDISLSKAYILSKDKNSGAKSFGAGKGVVYVNPERIKEIIQQHIESNKEKWD